MSFFSYLFNPWHSSTAAPRQQKNNGKGRANLNRPANQVDDDDRPQSHESGFIFFPPFIPGEQPQPQQLRKEAPDPHGTKEFLRAVIAERAGTRQQVVKAGEDIRRANQEALKQAKEHSHTKPTATPAYTSAAASSLKAILARNPLPNSKATKQQPAELPCPFSRPQLRRCDSSGSFITPVPPTTRIPTSPKNKQAQAQKKAKKKPSFFHIRFPTEPKRILARPERHTRPSPPIDPRLSPLGPMADRLVMMLDRDRDDYDSERE